MTARNQASIGLCQSVIERPTDDSTFIVNAECTADIAQYIADLDAASLGAVTTLTGKN